MYFVIILCTVDNEISISQINIYGMSKLLKRYSFTGEYNVHVQVHVYVHCTIHIHVHVHVHVQISYSILVMLRLPKLLICHIQLL